MPHAKEHPLAGYSVVTDARTGDEIYIVDWLDRLDGLSWLLRPSARAARLYRSRTKALNLHDSGAVGARKDGNLAIFHHAELPAYDPVPVGVIS